MSKQIITESFKNTILGWVGIRSNNTMIEDLIDAYYNDPKHAERKNRTLLKKLMVQFLKDKNVNNYKNELLNKSLNDTNVEASYNELFEEISMALKKMISSERYRKNKNRYEIAVKLITNALLAMLSPRLMGNSRIAYQKYAAELAKAEEEEKEKERKWLKMQAAQRASAETANSNHAKWSDPAWRDDEYAAGRLGDGKYSRH